VDSKYLLLYCYRWVIKQNCLVKGAGDDGEKTASDNGNLTVSCRKHFCLSSERHDIELDKQISFYSV